MLTAYAVYAKAADYLPFIQGLGFATVKAFVMKEVLPPLAYADQLMVMALADLLGVRVTVEYLDQSSGDRCTAHTFGPGAGGGATSGYLVGEHTRNIRAECGGGGGT